MSGSWSLEPWKEWSISLSRPCFLLEASDSHKTLLQIQTLHYLLSLTLLWMYIFVTVCITKPHALISFFLHKLINRGVFSTDLNFFILVSWFQSGPELLWKLPLMVKRGLGYVNEAVSVCIRDHMEGRGTADIICNCIHILVEVRAKFCGRLCMSIVPRLNFH